MRRRGYLLGVLGLLAGCSGDDRSTPTDGTTDPGSPANPAADPGATASPTRTTSEPTAETPPETEPEPTTERQTEEPTPEDGPLATAVEHLTDAVETYRRNATGADGGLAAVRVRSVSIHAPGVRAAVSNARHSLTVAERRGADPTTVARLRGVGAFLETSARAHDELVSAYDQLTWAFDRYAADNVDQGADGIEDMSGYLDDAAPSVDTLEAEFDESDFEAFPALDGADCRRKRDQLTTALETMRDFETWTASLGAGLRTLDRARVAENSAKWEVAEYRADNAVEDLDDLTHTLETVEGVGQFAPDVDRLIQIATDAASEARDVRERAATRAN